MSMAKKMISRLSVLAVLMVFLAACSKQTEYTNVIPADATAVASIDLKSLANKAGMNDKENEAAKQKLLEALKKEQKADAVERAWDTVKEWIASNQEHFEVKHLNEVAREPRLGRYEPGEKKTYILPNCLRKMLIDNGFSYEKSIRGFKDRGYVENRQENQRVGKSSVKVIIANIEQAYEYRKASEFF